MHTKPLELPTPDVPAGSSKHSPNVSVCIPCLRFQCLDFTYSLQEMGTLWQGHLERLGEGREGAELCQN